MSEFENVPRKEDIEAYFARYPGVEQFLAWFPGVVRSQVDAVLEHAARSAQAA